MMHGVQVCCVAFNRQPAGSALSSFEVCAIADAVRGACPEPLRCRPMLHLFQAFRTADSAICKPFHI